MKLTLRQILHAGWKGFAETAHLPGYVRKEASVLMKCRTAQMAGYTEDCPEVTDDTIGRTLDRLYTYGTQKIFSHVCMTTYKNYEVDCSMVHYDTMSVSVHGAYLPNEDDPIKITYGHSKDKRPDLKPIPVNENFDRGK